MNCMKTVTSDIIQCMKTAIKKENMFHFTMKVHRGHTLYMYLGAFTGTAYEWYPDGKLKKRLERFGNSRKVVEYDEDGNITRQY